MLYRNVHAGKSIQISINVLQKITRFSKEIKPGCIEVHGTLIPHNNEVKLLGITIDDKLKFDKQVNSLCNVNCSQTIKCII